MEYVCMLVCQKNYVLCQFFRKNGQNFNKITTKLRNEALIGKMYKKQKLKEIEIKFRKCLY